MCTCLYVYMYVCEARGQHQVTFQTLLHLLVWGKVSSWAEAHWFCCGIPRDPFASASWSWDSRCVSLVLNASPHASTASIFPYGVISPTPKSCFYKRMFQHVRYAQWRLSFKLFIFYEEQWEGRGCSYKGTQEVLSGPLAPSKSPTLSYDQYVPRQSTICPFPSSRKPKERKKIIPLLHGNNNGVIN